MYLVKYHGLHSQRLIVNQGRYLGYYYLFNSFNILLIKLNEACSVEGEILKPNCSAARILLVSR